MVDKEDYNLSKVFMPQAATHHRIGVQRFSFFEQVHCLCSVHKCLILRSRMVRLYESMTYNHNSTNINIKLCVQNTNNVLPA